MLECSAHVVRLLVAGAVMGVIAGTAVATPALAQDATEPKAVFDHHLGAFAQGIDAVLMDYTEASVLVTPDRAYRGLAEIRGFFQAFLAGATPEFWQAFTIRTQSVDGAIAYLVWAAPPAVPMATDTLYIRDGKIAVQTFTPFGG